MPKVLIEIDIPVSESRRIELHHAERAAKIALQEMVAAGGSKTGEHAITVPPDRPGAERMTIGKWIYQPGAAS